jgi:hypothetical protein
MLLHCLLLVVTYSNLLNEHICGCQLDEVVRLKREFDDESCDIYTRLYSV